MQETFEDFIGKFENSLSNETCNNIVKWFDSCSDKNLTQENSGIVKERKMGRKELADETFIIPSSVEKRKMGIIPSSASVTPSQSSSEPSPSSDDSSQKGSEGDLSSLDTRSSSSPPQSNDKGFFQGLRLPWSKPALSQDETLSGADQLGVLQVGHSLQPQTQSQQASSQPVD